MKKQKEEYKKVKKGYLMGSELLDYEYANSVLKEFNPDMYELERSISLEGYTAKCSNFEDTLYDEEYSDEMIYRIEEMQFKLKGIEEILKEYDNEEF